MNPARFDLRDCRRCRLCEGRTMIVNGTGPKDANVVFIGEAPGREEDLAGRPFVGRAGRLLDEALERAGSDRNDVFVTNLVRCRPPANRRPKGDEVAACIVNLSAELAAMDPTVICMMGQTVSQSLASTTGSMSCLAGKETEVSIDGRRFRGIVAYHPAACLYRRKNLDSFRSAVRKSLEEAGVV
jgi:uracil-DNA glycosylase family 4